MMPITGVTDRAQKDKGRKKSEILTVDKLPSSIQWYVYVY